jgi:cardiolipin synthase
LARKLDQVSHFGRFLDPIADKLLVAAVLVMLSAEQRISILGVFFAIIILFRELLVSGLREYLAQLNVPMPVTKLAKWKTTVQFVALTILLLGDAGPWALPWAIIGEVFLALAAALTIITGWQYLSTGYRAMTAAEITRDH